MLFDGRIVVIVELSVSTRNHPGHQYDNIYFFHNCDGVSTCLSVSANPKADSQPCP